MTVQRVHRRVLVIGSQCAAAPPLSFLPDVARDLATVFTDPRLGDCEPAVVGGPVLIDPPRADMIDKVRAAFAQADADPDGSALVLAFIGHGVSAGDDFYFLPYDGAGQGHHDEDVYLSQLLKEGLRDSNNLNGLLVLLDACQAGVGAAQAAEWREVGLGRHQRRYELLTASADRPAYGGIVARTLIQVLRRGIPSAGTTVDSRYLRDPLIDAAGDQNPQRITHDGGGWAQRGDEGLWWAYNAAHDATAGGASAVGAVRDRIVELTGYLQPTSMLAKLVVAATAAPRVAIVGPRGSGKSTLAAALARPDATHGQVPEGFVQAIAFAARASTVAELAGTLAAQLAEAVPGFADAGPRYLRRLTSAERQSLDALHQHVIGPLSLVDPTPAVRLVIDALDELPTATRSTVLHTLRAAGAWLRVVVTARPGAACPAGSHQITVENAAPDTIAEYLRNRSVAQEYRPALVRHAAGNWLHAYLLADRARRPGFDPAALPNAVRLTLDALYDDELLAAGADDATVWQSQLRPILGVLAVAGAGPVLPLALLLAASRHLNGPATITAVRDSLVRVSGLVVRIQPGQPAEQVGLFHPSLGEDYLLRPGDGRTIEPAECHAALAEAMNDLAPLPQHDLTDPIHRYALHAEAHHRWHASHDSRAVIESLTQRSAGSAVAEQERWQPWAAILAAALGADHPDTLAVQVNLAVWIGAAGNPGAARDQFADLLPIHERVFGREHSDTLAVRGYLAWWTGAAGHPDVARDQFADLLPMHQRVSGPEHPDTLAVRVYLAGWSGAAGNPKTARDQFDQLLSVYLRISGPEHPDTLAVRAHVARWTGAAGNPTAARDQCAELLPIYVRLCGPEHPDTLAVRFNLAVWTGAAGDPGAARDQFADLLPVRERLSGPEHPDTLAVLGNLARWTGAAGSPGAARDQFADLLPVHERVSGPEHPGTLAVRGYLAWWTGAAGDPGAARDQFADLLPVHQRVSGPEHSDTLVVRFNLAGWTGAAGDPGAARDQFADLLPVHERVSGSEHPDTLDVRAYLARWTGAAGDPVKARDQFAELLAVYMRVSGPEHPDTVVVRAQLAHWTKEAGYS